MNDIKLITNEDGVYANTRDIAERFSKKHAEVLYAIEGRLDKNGKPKNNGILMSGISQLSKMFIRTEYIDSMGRIKYEYLMNRDGFSLLCMGFTGNEALEWKLKYIDAFNKMETSILEINRKANLLLEIYNGGQSGIIAAKQLTELEVKEATVPLIAKIEEDKPLVDFANHVTESSDTVDVGEFAKIVKNEKIDIGRNRLFEWLRKNKYLMDGNVPYQKYINNGYFEVIETTKSTAYGSKLFPKTLIMGKGQVALVEKLRAEFGMKVGALPCVE